jgi:hypothetical protein
MTFTQPHSLLLNHPLVYAFGKPLTGVATWVAAHSTRVEPLTAALPDNVQLVTWVRQPGSSPHTYLLRLHHLFAVGEDAALSLDASVDLKGLFVGLEPTLIQELSLSANQVFLFMHCAMAFDAKTNTLVDFFRSLWQMLANDCVSRRQHHRPDHLPGLHNRLTTLSSSFVRWKLERFTSQ